MAPRLDQIKRLPCFALLAKYYMLTINVIFFLSGLLLMALGSYAYDQGLSGFISSDHIAVGIIIIGIIFILVSFVGFLGAIRESRRTMIVYLVFVCIFSIIEIAIAIAAYARRDQLPVVAQAAWTATYNLGTTNGNNTLLDLETGFRCCGYANPTDMAIPDACEADLHYNVGCRDAILATVSSSLVTVGAIAAIFGTLQLVSIIFSCVVIKFFKPATNDAALVGDE